MAKRLISPLDNLETAAPMAPVSLGRPCPSCGQTMVQALSSGKNILFCTKDGVALPDDDANDIKKKRKTVASDLGVET